MRTEYTQNSKGHIAWVGDLEYYERDGEVYRAHCCNVMDIFGYRLGRWECSRTHFDRFRHVILEVA